jgi:N-acetylglucosaminyldiphosphoundecaprenol N-acetyl-beta-D-mannosaminyltransferase
VSALRVPLFGVEVDVDTPTTAVERAREIVRCRVPSQHVVLNAAKVVAMHESTELRDVVRSCAMVNADGVSVVLAARALGQRLPGRVTGIDLFLDLVTAAANDGSSIFLLGARPEVVERTASELRRRHPSLRIAGVHDGYWDDDAAVVAAVRAASPDYLFLAIPSPRKEFWSRDHLAELGVPFVMGVGGSFDVVAGVTSRAPVFVQRIGMEWAWRLGQEPRRMWRRYLVGNTKFVVLVGRTWLGARSASRRAAP